MATRSSERWWFEYWGRPCDRHDPTPVTIGGHRFTTDSRMVPAWEAWERVRARHGYVVHPPYPEGDSGMYNCRHIGSDPDRPWSVHAWGGAIDVNWQTNPDGSRLITDMPQAMRDDLHALRTRDGAPLFRWGGDWDRDPRTGHSYYDAMHWEIVATPAEIASGIIDPNDDKTPQDEEEDDEDMKTMGWFQKGDGPQHCYIVAGNTASWVRTHDAINFNRDFAKVPMLPGILQYDPWLSGLAVLNGPFQNVTLSSKQAAALTEILQSARKELTNDNAILKAIKDIELPSGNAPVDASVVAEAIVAKLIARLEE